MANTAIACILCVLAAILIYLAVSGNFWKNRAGRREIQRLRSVEERLNALLSCSSDIIWELDSTGNVKYVSEGVARILGYSPQEIMGAMLHTLIADRESMATLLKYIDTRHDAQQDGYVALLHKKGYRVYCQANGQKTFDRSGAHTGYIGVLRNVTEQVLSSKLSRHNEQILRQQSSDFRKLNEQLREQNMQISQTAQRLGEAAEKVASMEADQIGFLSSIVHEIIGPILAIEKLAGRIIRNDMSPQFRSTAMAQLKERREHMMEMSQDLTDYDMIAKGCMRISLATGNIGELIGSLCDFHYYRNLYSDKKPVSMKTSICLPDSSLVARADFKRLRQILYTLILQAYRNTEVGEIMLSCRLIGSEIQFSVADSGKGIPESAYKYIFSPYMCWAKTSGKNPEAAHMAISLSICKSLAEMMGGRMWFESELNKGSTFYFTIPYISSSEQAEISKPQYCWRGHTILLMGYSKYTNALISGRILGTGAKFGSILLDSPSEPSPTYQAFANYFKSVSLMLLDETAVSHPSAVSLVKRYPSAPLILIDKNFSIGAICKEIDEKLNAQKL